jgi:hypothetical protein
LQHGGCHPMFCRPKCLADLAAARGSFGVWDAIDAAGVDGNGVHRLRCSHFDWAYSFTWLPAITVLPGVAAW